MWGIEYRSCGYSWVVLGVYYQVGEYLGSGVKGVVRSGLSDTK